MDQEKTLLKQISPLERKLRQQIKNTGLFNKKTQALLKQEETIFSDLIKLSPVISFSKNVHEKLWKWVFYRQVSAYRGKIQATRNQKKNQKILNSFYKFIVNSLSFYTELVSHFSNLLENTMVFKKEKEENQEKEKEKEKEKANEKKKVYEKLLFKFHICLGDLLRYQDTYFPNLNKPKNQSSQGGNQTNRWGTSVSHYNQALRYDPDNGFVHNNLAVFACQKHDNLESLSEYCLSLMVSKPYSSAVENILSFLENNRKELEMYSTNNLKQQSNRYAINKRIHYQNRNRGGSVHQNRNRYQNGNGNMQNEQSQQMELPNSKKFPLMFVNVNGFLISKIDQDLFVKRKPQVIESFKQFLSEDLLIIFDNMGAVFESQYETVGLNSPLHNIVIIMIFAFGKLKKERSPFLNDYIEFIQEIIGYIFEYCSTMMKTQSKYRIIFDSICSLISIWLLTKNEIVLEESSKQHNFLLKKICNFYTAIRERIIDELDEDEDEDEDEDDEGVSNGSIDEDEDEDEDDDDEDDDSYLIIDEDLKYKILPFHFFWEKLEKKKSIGIGTKTRLSRLKDFINFLMEKEILFFDEEDEKFLTFFDDENESENDEENGLNIKNNEYSQDTENENENENENVSKNQQTNLSSSESNEPENEYKNTSVSINSEDIVEKEHYTRNKKITQQRPKMSQQQQDEEEEEEDDDDDDDEKQELEEKEQVEEKENKAQRDFGNIKGPITSSNEFLQSIMKNIYN
ncbi:smg-7 suppressor with morphological effect on genitalia protein [Anaeramoeba flamelloides]|uniref:Smg-7 suppressor with morphological effect on genitalia protein n=1 Tax=Anaeramoeba flamelloides TaxID=1746091 RepID=A0ABQ8XHM0_9EUKA|nr:smg-7 suppressor with morphological effect on genitalia protein [Anaeramoeba flamelloides]